MYALIREVIRVKCCIKILDICYGRCIITIYGISYGRISAITTKSSYYIVSHLVVGKCYTLNLSICSVIDLKLNCDIAISLRRVILIITILRISYRCNYGMIIIRLTRCNGILISVRMLLFHKSIKLLIDSGIIKIQCNIRLLIHCVAISSCRFGNNIIFVCVRCGPCQVKLIVILSVYHRTDPETNIVALIVICVCRINCIPVCSVRVGDHNSVFISCCYGPLCLRVCSVTGTSLCNFKCYL